MGKTYQKTGFDVPSGTGLAGPAVPPLDRVSVAMAEITENVQEGLLALAVGAGLQVMSALMEADVAALAG